MRSAAFLRLLAVMMPLALCAAGELESLRDRQDRAGLAKAMERCSAQASSKPGDARAQYQLALAESYLAEVAIEQKDKNTARAHAEEGIKFAEKAVALNPSSAEYHRVLGTLCGQVIPANPLLGLRYGKCAQEAVNKAVELDPKSALAWVSRGVGNYYLPASFGGGVDLAIRDFEKAIQLEPNSAEAYLWLGIAERKAGRNAEARKALQKSLQLNPGRVWTKQQLEKTAAQ